MSDPGANIADDAPIDERTASALLAKVSSMFDEKMGTLKRAIVDEQQTLSQKIEKRLKTSDTKFKKKSHTNQFEVNTEVREHLNDAKGYLLTEPPRVAKAVELLDEGMHVLDERNKDIEIADYSEFGWTTVEEYRKRGVADDSDDDKRLKKAEQSAAKINTRKRTASRGRRGFSRASFNNNNNYSSGFNYNANVGNQPFRGGRGRSFFPRRQFTGKCFGCGVRGHWREECPNMPPEDPYYGSASAVAN